MNPSKKVGLVLVIFVLVSQISLNLARPSRGNRRSKTRESKAKRNWPNSAGTIGETKTERDLFSSGSDMEANAELNALEIQQGTEASLKTPPTKWLDLERTMPSTMSAPINSDLVLECNGVGSPPPQIYWLKDGKPVEFMSAIEIDRFANTVFGWDMVKRGETSSPRQDFAMANVKSKLPLKCLKPEDEGEYTCIAENEGKQLVATTKVTIDDTLSTELRPECLAQYTKKGKKIQPAFIMTYEYLHMETIGNDALLKCTVGGRPYPQVSWLDNDGKMISHGKKFKITDSGNLLIRNLSWREMGEYTCRATNEFGSESAATFLYPLLREANR